MSAIFQPAMNVSAMRLSFPNGEHADFVLSDGVANVGQASGNTLVLAGKDVAARHASLQVDARGIVLEILDDSARTHLNARPVREKAVLRLGDVLCLGTVTALVKMDRDDLIDTSVPAETAAPMPATTPARTVLRGVSDSHFGKTIAVAPRLMVGSATDCGLFVNGGQIAARHAVVEQVGEAIYLRGADPESNSRVNGVSVRDAVIFPGDQLGFGQSHFIVEAPGLPLRGEIRSDAVSNTNDAPMADASAKSSVAGASAHPMRWLVGVAALIAFVLVLLLHRGI